MKDIRPKIRYSLGGLEDYILSLTRLPDFTPYTLDDIEVAKKVVKRGTRLRDVLRQDGLRAPDNDRDGVLCFETHPNPKPENVMGNGNGLRFILYLCVMTTLSDIKETLKSHKDRLSSKYGLSNIAIFGSYGRGQQTADSDIDILVDFKQPIGIEFIDLAEELERLLKIKVDLVSKNGVKPDYFKQIETDLNYV